VSEPTPDPVVPSHSSRLKQAIAQGGLARIASFIGPLLLLPFAARILGPVDYGIYTIAGVAAAVVPALDLGLRYAMVTRLAAPLARGDQASARQLSTTTLAAMVVLGAALGPMLAILSINLPLDRWFHLTDGQASDLADCLIVVFTSFALQLPLSLGMTLLMAQQRFGAYWFWSAVTPVAVVAAGIGSLLATGDIRWLAVATFATPVMIMVFPATILLRSKAWRPRLPDLSLEALRSVARLGPTNSIALLIVAAFSQIDRVLVQVFLGPAAAGVYNVAQRAIAVPHQTLTVAVQPLWPAFGAALADGRHEWIRRTMTKVQLTALAAGALMAVGFVLLGDPFIRILAGPGFDTSWQVRAALGLWLIVALPLAPVAMFLNAAGVRLAIVLPPLGGVALAVVTGIVLVPSISESGAALAAAIGTGLGGTLPITWYAHRLLAGKMRLPAPTTVDPLA
jgi:O-antigen/teichoic acid export membrane protein